MDLFGRLHILCSLFLCTLLVMGCRRGNESVKTEITVIRDGTKATGIRVRLENSGPVKELKINLESYPDQQVLGYWVIDKDEAEFIGLVPFTPGNSYEVYLNQQFIGSFDIELSETLIPEIINIYPSSDTIPQNLLKIYIEFSMPMSEGEAHQYVSMIDIETGDTLDGTFLDLKPELWNTDNTLLTLWLDPGRIKRGLIPNQEMGSPLEMGKNYKLMVSDQWRASNRMALSMDFEKSYYTINRDSLSPIPGNWKLQVPKAGTDTPLRVEFGEPMDGVLAVEAIEVLSEENALVPGYETLQENEIVYEFRPANAWKMGDYSLLIETRLEDLAGNNINRLFEENISEKEEKSDFGDQVELSFRIQ